MRCGERVRDHNNDDECEEAGEPWWNSRIGLILLAALPLLGLLLMVLMMWMRRQA